MSLHYEMFEVLRIILYNNELNSYYYSKLNYNTKCALYNMYYN